MSRSETHHSQPSTSTGASGRGYRSRRRIDKRTGARGRGCRGGYQERLTSDGEQSEQLDEAEVAELEARYARRAINTNADRYEEPEPEIGLDGMNSIELHIVDIMQCNFIYRASNSRTRNRP
jgi:hypothetical protein